MLGREIFITFNTERVVVKELTIAARLKACSQC